MAAARLSLVGASRALDQAVVVVVTAWGLKGGCCGCRRWRFGEGSRPASASTGGVGDGVALPLCTGPSAPIHKRALPARARITAAVGGGRLCKSGPSAGCRTRQGMIASWWAREGMFLGKVAAGSFAVGAAMEGFMIATGFYDVATRLEAQRREEFQEEIRLWQKTSGSSEPPTLKQVIEKRFH
eukprot:scaffold897_cov402-Prasinococcus_capsulatus_cf.AAC.20